MRFNRKVRILTSALFTLNAVVYQPITIFGASLTLSQVSGLSLHVAASIISLICVFYTSIGGFKAVVWADAVQSLIMFSTVVTIGIVGLSKAGGFEAVVAVAQQGQRMEVSLNLDPTVRLTFWSTTVGITFLWLSDAVSPASMQRYLSLPSLQQARKAAFIRQIGSSLLMMLCIFIGMIVYATYSTCDPLTTQKIERPDQILPFFVLDVVGHLRGLPGLFVAGVVCASLSSVSTVMNALTGTIYEDFLEPVIGKKSERFISNIMKLISFVAGVIFYIFVFIVEKLGNIIDICSAASGVINGSIVGIFIMGVLFPRTNSKGAFYGGLISAVFMIWTVLGHELSTKCIRNKPISIEGCSNFTLPDSKLKGDDCEEMPDWFKASFPLYKLTTFYFGLLGTSLSIILGLIISYFTGFNNPSKVNPELLSPVIRSLSTEQDSGYTEVPVENTTTEEDNRSVVKNEISYSKIKYKIRTF